MSRYIKRRVWVVLLLFGCLAIAQTTQAASFDCGKATTNIDKMICADAALSKLDEELNAAYKAALQDGKQADSIKRAQKQWMKERNGCEDAACVKRVYEARLHGLSPAIAAHTPAWADGLTSGSIDMRESGHPFKLIKGKSVEVCEIYKKNLEALGNPNLACERKVSPEYEGLIKLPEWRKLDLWENRNLWSQVEKMARSGVNMPGRMQSKDTTWDDQREIDKLAKSYQEHTEQYHEEVYKLFVANMDVDNDGKIDSVLREHSGLCGEHRTYKSIALFVLDEKGGSVDLQKSRPLFQDSWYSPWAKKLEQSGTFSNGSMHDVFFYKEKTYFDRWAWTGIWIYKISNGKTEAICRLN